MTTTTPDAVDEEDNKLLKSMEYEKRHTGRYALEPNNIDALAEAYSLYAGREPKDHYLQARSISQCLLSLGFTITRAEPAMSEAELEREANELSFLTRDFKCVVGIDDAIALAKKYRG